MAHGMPLDLPGETVNVWTVIVTVAALRKHTEQCTIFALFFLYKWLIVDLLFVAGILYHVVSLRTVCQCSTA